MVYNWKMYLHLHGIRNPTQRYNKHINTQTMNTIIEQLNWRYATKQYDTTKKVSAEDLAILKESVRLAPSSFGLQPYKVFVIESAKVREQLREKSYGQPQVTDASHFFVFAAQDTMDASHIDTFIQLIADTRGVAVTDLQGFSNHLKGAAANLPADKQAIWNAKQAYIGLGMLLTTAASMNIDASPMEGFDAAGYKEVLGLTGYTPVVIAAVGYRSPDDATQHQQKVRKPIEHLFETV